MHDINNFKEKSYSLIEDYHKLLPLYLKSKTKIDLLSDFEKLSFKMIELLIHYKSYYQIFSEPDENLPKEHQEFVKIKDKVLNILKKLRIKNYKNWINSSDKKFIFKSAYGFERKLKCYERNFNFIIFSLEDPLTEDEITYIQSFFNSVYETNHIDLNTISNEQLTFALKNLLTN
tara:strand:- start:486 stop:1010 length:525 start_codon:yes stop_codon:yes gene_type:complete